MPEKKLPKAYMNADPYIRWTAAILHSFLTRTTPKELEDERDFILKIAPKLLDVMVDLASHGQKRSLKTVVDVLKLKQHLMQGVDLGQSPIKSGRSIASFLTLAGFLAASAPKETLDAWTPTKP